MAEPPSEQENGQPVPRRELSSGFQDMLGRMISDPEFRREMAADPEQALWEAGIELSPQELERVRSMSADDRRRLLEEVDPRDPRAWWQVIWRWVSWW